MTESIATKGAGGTAASRRTWGALALLVVPCLLVTMDLTILLLAVPQLSRSLQPSSSELLWISDVYGFCIAAGLVLAGAAGDRFGRRRVLLGGAAVFAAGSLVAMLADGPLALILARAAQGIGGAGMLPSIMAMAFAMFTEPKLRATALGVLMGSFAAGAALGPLVGGVLLDSFSWQSVFIPNVVLMLILLLLGPVLLPRLPGTGSGRVDLPSALLSVLAVLCIVWGIKEAAHDGLGLRALAAVVVGLLLVLVFVRRQRTIDHPLVDLSMFRSRPLTAVLAGSMTAYLVLYGVSFMTAQLLQLVIGLSPLQAGLWGLAPVSVTMVAAGIVPRLAAKVRPAALLGSGLCVSAAGLLLLALGADAGLAVIIPAQMALAVGTLPITVFGLTLIMSAAPAEHTGAASGLGEAANELGGGLGIALLGSLGTAVYAAHVSGIGDSMGTDVANGSLAGAHEFANSLPDGFLQAANLAFVDGVQTVAFTGAAVLVLTAGTVAHALRKLPAQAAQMQQHQEPAIGDD